MPKSKCVRAVARGGLGGLQPPHFFSDQLTLSQPGGGAHYVHHITMLPRIFRRCDGPAIPMHCSRRATVLYMGLL